MLHLQVNICLVSSNTVLIPGQHIPWAFVAIPSKVRWLVDAIDGRGDSLEIILFFDESNRTQSSTYIFLVVVRGAW